EHVLSVDGVPGAELANELAERATAAGVTLREAEVTALEAFSSTRWVGCADGSGYSAAAVVVAFCTRFKKLGVPGEGRMLGRGVIGCTPCDGALFAGRRVAVFGSGDHALGDARYLAGLGVEVTLLAPDAVTVEAVEGSDRVEAVTLVDAATGRR